MAPKKTGNAGEDDLKSVDSGKYRVVPDRPTNEYPTSELSMVEAHDLDLAQEEFPEGPYGAATNEEKLGKTSPWEPGQRSGGRFRDSNPNRSDRTIPIDEPDFDKASGSIEGQN